MEDVLTRSGAPGAPEFVTTFQQILDTLAEAPDPACLGAPARPRLVPEDVLEQRHAARIAALAQPEECPSAERGIAMGTGDLEEGGDTLAVFELR